MAISLKDLKKIGPAQPVVTPRQQPAEVPIAPIGHNNPPVDETDAMQARIVEEVGRAGVYLKKLAGEAPDAEGEAIKKLGEDLLNLDADAEALRAKIKKPHWDKCTSIDTAFRAMRAPIAPVVAELRKLLKAILDERQRKLDEEAKRLAEANATDGAPSEEIKAEKATIGKAKGKRAASLKGLRTADITDWRAAAIEFEAHPDVRAVVQKLADKLASIKAERPWMKVKSDTEAKFK
jgi:hypothetical protein